jgi:H+-transporting ATPase
LQSTIDVLCADQTGTLTTNQLVVGAVQPPIAPGHDEADILAFAALASSTDGLDPIDSAIRSLSTPTNRTGKALPAVVHFTQHTKNGKPLTGQFAFRAPTFDPRFRS